jgi:hypothetical protein
LIFVKRVNRREKPVPFGDSGRDTERDKVGKIADHLERVWMLSGGGGHQQRDPWIRHMRPDTVKQVANEYHLVAALGRLEYQNARIGHSINSPQ